MKKLILITVLLALMGSLSAQTATIDLLAGNTSAVYKVSQTLTNTTVKYFQWNAPQAVPISVNYSATLTKVTGTHTDVLIELYGKCFVGDAWTLITSANSGEISTTYAVSLKSSASNQYRYFKTVYTGTGTATTTITNQEFKIWLR